MTVKIVLPIPGSALNAHAKGNSHWSKSKATKEQRALAYLKTKQIVSNASGAPWERASIVYAFFWPDKRRRDETNYMQMLKGAVDGIVDAGLICADDWQHLNNRGAISEVDRENPRVELLISEVQNGN